MEKNQLRAKFTSEPIPGMNIVTAVVTGYDGLVVEIDNPDGYECCGTKDSYVQKMRDLGIKPGQRFYIILDESQGDPTNLFTHRARNNWSAIWSRNRLKDMQKDKPECQKCEHSFGHKHYKRYSFKKCRDCEHGLNIVRSFIIDENYRMFFGIVKKHFKHNT